MLDIAVDYIHNYLSRVKASRIFPHGATAHGSFTVLVPQNVTAKPGLHINHGVFIHAGAPVTIGQNVVLSAYCKIITTSLELSSSDFSMQVFNHSHRAISIGDNVWIGVGAVLLPGVSIGDNSVIGAASVVTKSVPASTLVLGNPARVAKIYDSSQQHHIVRESQS